MISIARDFSLSPAARYRKEGPNSGQRFREELLYPPLAAGQKVIVNLDGAVGYGSSFLEEAFGGLIRSGLTLDELESRLTIESKLATYKNRVWRYIRSAAALARPRG
ncbi:hypothetical protein DD235_02345 [Corticimicrobacter populi]|uniref:DUF4325 domain-containing protein n=2 Tax=Corticimicrobacter populi TaxID=2175229 RepID=A0A2V1K7C5_9BURK|nr:STAS-like domain-containing protein [Corticimicrobacter populi]PWF25569.1 hypothetical protein DD235_02345 [Corticimicrobacter populi]